MAIEITEFTNVSISISPTGVASGNFGILGFLTNEEGVIGTAERGRAYAGLASVGNDWAADTEVYKAAQAFYAATPTPTDFVVLMCFETNQAATLTGGGSQTVEELIQITAGNFSITTDSGTAAIENLDFSGVNPADGYAGIATALETAINAVVTGTVTVTHTGLGFEVKSTTTGKSSTISFADGSTGAGTVDAAEALGLEQHQGKVSAGIDAESPVQALAETLTLGIDYTGLVTHKKYRDNLSGGDGEKTLDIANWAEAAKKIFCNTSNDLSVLNSALETDIISLCKGNTLRYTLSTFSKYKAQYPSAAVFGRAASVNFSGIDTTITLNLKQIPTITAEDLTPGEFAVLRQKRGSAVVRIGKSVNAYSDSRMASGSWLDTTHGLLWLENRCEVDMFNLLYQSATKVPYTQSGINTAAATLTRSLEAAVRNGLAAPGFLPDGTYLPEGFEVTAVALADVPSSDRGNRIYSGLGFKMVGAGALHEVVVSGTFSE